MANDLSAFQKQVFVKQLMTKVAGVNVMLANNLVNRDWDGDLQGTGGLITVRSIGSITMRDYTRTTDVQFEDLVPSKETFLVDKGRYFAFYVDDLDKYTSEVDALEAYAEQAKDDMNADIEARILGVYTKADAANKITDASNAAIAITPTNVYSTLLRANKALDDQRVPAAGRWAVIDSATKMALANSPDLVRSTSMGDNIVRGVAANAVGFVGSIAGFDLYAAGKVPEDSGARYIVYGDPKAITYAGVVREVERLRPQNKFADAIKGLLVDGAFVSDAGSKRLGYIKVTKQ